MGTTCLCKSTHLINKLKISDMALQELPVWLSVLPFSEGGEFLCQNLCIPAKVHSHDISLDPELASEEVCAATLHLSV